MKKNNKTAIFPDHCLAISKYGEHISPRTKNQEVFVREIDKCDIVFGIGPAGTGKTFLATLMGLRGLMNKQYEKLILSRPVVEAGESLGFLPGDISAKLHPYLKPIYDVIEEFIPTNELNELMKEGAIEVAPLAYMRGRSFKRSFVVLDEAQNASPEQLKMLLTRLGRNSKIVISGDASQSDLRGGRSGLLYTANLLKHINSISYCEFSNTDVCRHPLVQAIVDVYEHASIGSHPTLTLAA